MRVANLGVSMAFTSFALMMIVAALECRSEKATVFTTATLDSKYMNYAALGEFVLAVLTTQMDALRRILGTTDLSTKQFRWALIPPVVLLGLWELGKVLARRRTHVSSPT
jgi:P-type Ca2+ transporter type 2C